MATRFYWCILFVFHPIYAKTVHYKKVLDNDQAVTPKTYELPVPGSNPITIIEADQPLWQQDKLHFHFNDDDPTNRKHRSYRKKFPFQTSEPEQSVDKKRPALDDDDDSPSEFTATDLNKFLQEYTKRLKIPMKNTETPSAAMEKVDLIERPSSTSSPTTPGYIDKSKATWDEKGGYNHPYDDRKGWVTLEAVPWSTSKVSKWESNKRPTHWSDPKPYNRPFEMKPSRPNYNTDYASHYGLETAYNRPNWDKNDYEPMFDRHRPKDCHRDIVTDNQPGNFPAQSIGFVPYAESFERPSYDLRPSASQIHPATYPDSGDGQWVLLSTTKGYQYPKKRQRSLDVKPDTLSSHKTVHLTVLPALNGSDVNMTTSHGGLLQVDSSFETVDEARRSYIRKLKLNATRKGVRKPHRNPQAQQQVAANVPDPTAVLAAVGAGMVPATMAMVMPMVLGRRRRSVPQRAPPVEMTLQRNL